MKKVNLEISYYTSITMLKNNHTAPNIVDDSILYHVVWHVYTVHLFLALLVDNNDEFHMVA